MMFMCMSGILDQVCEKLELSKPGKRNENLRASQNYTHTTHRVQLQDHVYYNRGTMFYYCCETGERNKTLCILICVCVRILLFFFPSPLISWIFDRFSFQSLLLIWLDCFFFLSLACDTHLYADIHTVSTLIYKITGFNGRERSREMGEREKLPIDKKNSDAATYPCTQAIRRENCEW